MDRMGYFRDMLNEIHTKKYCLCYLDFLGSSEAMLSEDSDKFLNDLNNILFDVEGDFGQNNPFSNKNLFIKIFSDNILFGFEIKESLEKCYSNLENVINIALDTQNKAISYGYLLRGAITSGDFFINDSFVYGKALVHAVKMEEKQASSPRIIATKEIVDVLPQYFCPLADENDNYTLNNLIAMRNNIDFQHIHLLNKLKKEKNNSKATEKNIMAINHYNYCIALGGEIYAPIFKKITQEDIEKALI